MTEEGRAVEMGRELRSLMLGPGSVVLSVSSSVDRSPDTGCCENQLFGHKFSVTLNFHYVSDILYVYCRKL